MAKLDKFHLLVAALVLIAIVLLGFILSHTLLKGRLSSFSVAANSNLKLVTSLPHQNYKVNFEGNEFNLNSSELALSTSNGQLSDSNYDLSTTNVMNKFTWKFNSNSEFAYFDEKGEVLNCSNRNFKIAIDDNKLKKEIVNQLNNQTIQLELQKIVKDNESVEIFYGCKKYNETNLAFTKLFEKIDDFDFRLEQFISLIYKDKKYSWTVNKTSYDNFLFKLADKFYVLPQEGEYKIRDNKVLLFKQYKEGRYVNIEETAKNILTWFNSDEKNENPISLVKVLPSILSSDRQILDFTQVVGEGKTRIDLIRNGQGNAAVYFAELGLQEIDGHIIPAGKEFSYIKKIAKQPGINYTSAGRLIGYGYCNSTTTIFRAALETGLKITERQDHGFLVPSYDWGYPYNLVDAAFWGVEGEEVDLKFVNNFKYPIMLRFLAEKDKNGFQYHTVQILSSAKAKKRDVKLYDWKIWNKASERSFDGSFQRTVKENGKVLIQDEVLSRYR